MEILAAIKKYLILVINQQSQNTMIIQTKHWQNEDETRGVLIEEFVGLKPKMYLILVDNSKRKKSKGINRNVVVTIGHNEYNDVLLNNECIRYSINIIQSKDHRIGAFGINKIQLSCFDDKIYI